MNPSVILILLFVTTATLVLSTTDVEEAQQGLEISDQVECLSSNWTCRCLPENAQKTYDTDCSGFKHLKSFQKNVSFAQCKRRNEKKKCNWNQLADLAPSELEECCLILHHCVNHCASG